MGNLEPSTAAFVIGIGGVVLWWLIQQKDKSTQAQLQSNREKMQALESRLNALDVRLAADYSKKSELDVRFDRLENAITKGMSDLGNRMDRMRDAQQREHVA